MDFLPVMLPIPPTRVPPKTSWNHIYIAGGQQGHPTSKGWFIRRSSDHGTTWTTVEGFPAGPLGDLHFIPGPAGGLFAAGTRFNGTYSTWLIRRSRDAGATWTTVHTYSAAGDAIATAMDSAPYGTLFVGGTGSPNVTKLKSSPDRGDTWQPVQVPGRPDINTLGVDGAGNLYAAGYFPQEPQLGVFSMLRRTPAGVWEDLGPMSNTLATFRFAIDTSGSVVAGCFRWPEGRGVRSELIVRELLVDPVMLPPLSIARAGDPTVISWPGSVTDAVLESTDSFPTSA